MKPVYQTRIGSEGDCLAACVASITELPLRDFPRIGPKDTDWSRKLQTFLEPFGIGLAWFWHKEEDSNAYPPGYSIAARFKKDSEALHAIVYKDGLPIHDPYPPDEHGKELLGVAYWIVFTVLDPRILCRVSQRNK